MILNNMSFEPNVDVSNFSNVCRLCLSSNEKLKSLFKLEELETLALNFSTKLSYCTSIKVSRNDILPHRICHKCYNQVNVWYAFKKMCIKSDIFLKKLLKNNADRQQNSELKTLKPSETFKYLDIDFEDMGSYIEESNLLDIPVELATSDGFGEEIQTSEPFENTEEILEEDEIRKPLLRKMRQKFKCNECSDSFYLESSLSNHIRLNHKRVNKVEKSNSRKTNPIRYEMKCNMCGKIFHQKVNFRYHFVRKHPGQKPFMCDVCGKNDFISEETLGRHKMLHSGKHKCSTCGKTFTCNAILMTHIRDKHENDKPYVCDFCGKRYVNELRMNYHKRCHTGEKKYICDQCGLAVATSSSLAKHKRLHDSVKPFSCEMCGKGFVTRTRFVEHYRLHTGERPFSCNICNKSFTIQYKLKRHMKIHEPVNSNYAYEDCESGASHFDGLSNLKSQHLVQTV